MAVKSDAAEPVNVYAVIGGGIAGVSCAEEVSTFAEGNSNKFCAHFAWFKQQPSSFHSRQCVYL